VDDDIKLRDVVALVDEGGGEAITSRTMLAALMKKFGGMDGFVDQVNNEWAKTEPGSITHRSILRMFVSLTINASQSITDDDLENLDDEQLIIELQKTFRLLVKRKADGGQEVEQIAQ
jgi:hypothetical protein